MQAQEGGEQKSGQVEGSANTNIMRMGEQATGFLWKRHWLSSCTVVLFCHKHNFWKVSLRVDSWQPHFIRHFSMCHDCVQGVAKPSWWGVMGSGILKERIEVIKARLLTLHLTISSPKPQNPEKMLPLLHLTILYKKWCRLTVSNSDSRNNSKQEKNHTAQGYYWQCFC